MSGVELDGEIADPANAGLPSGDGVRGGQAVFRINVLQGDASREGVVDGDESVILASLGRCAGNASFDPRADLNSDGCVNVLDVNIFTTGNGRSLPPTDGIAPTLVDLFFGPVSVPKNPSALSTKNLRIDGFDAVATVSRPWLVFSEAVKWA